MYHGAALNQIAEHERFTAINAYATDTGVSRSTFLVNNKICVYLKYATKPNSLGEYVFTFNQSHLAELKKIERGRKRAFIALVCVEDREICCLPLKSFRELLNRRRTRLRKEEDQYTLLLSLPKGKSFRVYVSAPGKKMTTLGFDGSGPLPPRARSRTMASREPQREGGVETTMRAMIFIPFPPARGVWVPPSSRGRSFSRARDQLERCVVSQARVRIQASAAAPASCPLRPSHRKPWPASA